MLLCKACNTRFPEGPSACPSCGRRHFAAVSSGPQPEEPSALPEATRLEDETGSAGPTAAQAHVELDELDVLADAVEPTAAGELKPEPNMARRRQMREPGPAVFHLSAAQVRTLVAEQPELLEPGMGIFTDEHGKAVGVDYRTPVGPIDLLARDASGGLVVVMVSDIRDAESLMPEVLGRVGYVRKHVAAAGQSVRSVVVIEEIPEALSYAAAGVSGTIAFKAYRVALTFHDLKF